MKFCSVHVVNTFICPFPMFKFNYSTSFWTSISVFKHFDKIYLQFVDFLIRINDRFQSYDCERVYWIYVKYTLILKSQSKNIVRWNKSVHRKYLNIKRDMSKNYKMRFKKHTSPAFSRIISFSSIHFNSQGRLDK